MSVKDGTASKLYSEANWLSLNNLIQGGHNNNIHQLFENKGMYMKTCMIKLVVSHLILDQLKDENQAGPVYTEIYGVKKWAPVFLGLGTHAFHAEIMAIAYYAIQLIGTKVKI